MPTIDFETGFTKFLDDQGLDEDELGLDEFRAQLEDYKEEYDKELDKRNRVASQPETQAAPPSEEDTQADIQTLAELKQQLDDLTLQRGIAANGGDQFRRHAIEQQQLEVQRAARSIEQRLARAKIGSAYEKATTDELEATLEAKLDRAEDLKQETPDTKRPRRAAQLEREKQETQHAITSIHQELSHRNEQRAHDEILAWRESIVAEKQGALDAIQKAERDREGTQQAAKAKPFDRRAQLDVEDAQKQVQKAYERFNSAHRSIPFPQG